LSDSSTTLAVETATVVEGGACDCDGVTSLSATLSLFVLDMDKFSN